MPVKLDHLADEVVDTDFLIIGAGMAGCMAALRARAEGNIDVAVMERSIVKYSGSVMGWDDFPFMIPHPTSQRSDDRPGGGNRPDPFGASMRNPQLMATQSKTYTKTLAILEEIGVRLREDDGTYKMTQDGKVPGGAHANRPVPNREGKYVGEQIFYRGTDVKQKLALAVQKSGARIFDRTLLTSLITEDGSVVGATGLNTRTGKFIVFKAKKFLISTGGAWRLYMYPYGVFPNALFFQRNSPLSHGGGMVAAFRAGAKLANLEFLNVHVSVAGFGSSGSIARGFFWPTRNYEGEILEKKYLGKGDMMAQVFNPSIEAPEIERNVIFADLRSVAEDEVQACYFSAATEGPRSLKFLKLRGGVEGPPVESRALVLGLRGGLGGVVAVNDKAETSLRNLFIAGDTSCGVGGPSSGALGWGYIIGNNVRELAPEMKQSDFGSEQVKQVKAEKERVFAPLGRSGDVSPLELEDYVRKINSNYISVRKTEPRMKRAIDIMRTIKERFVPALAASDFHGLTHALEIQDIIQLSELHAQASLLRTESRLGIGHYRVDYPNQDDERWRGLVIMAENAAGEAKFASEKLS